MYLELFIQELAHVRQQPVDQREAVVLPRIILHASQKAHVLHGVTPQQSRRNALNVDRNTQICLLHVTWALMVGGACSPLGAKSSYLNSGSSTKRSTMSGGAARTTAENKHITEAAVSGQMTTRRMTMVMHQDSGV